MRYSIQTGKNNPILRTISDEVQQIDESLIVFSKELVRLMRKHKWVGLAAPQVGINLRVIATTQWGKKKEKNIFLSETIMINPRIIETSVDYISAEEACISLPDERGNVRRWRAIAVEYLDIKGKKQKKKFKDFDATIIQHEIDHLDGMLFVDKLSKRKK